MPSSVSPAMRAPVAGVAEGVLVQRVAARQRALPQRDVVRLRSGEVLQGGAARLGRHQPQVGLHLVGQQDAGLGVAEARGRAPTCW
jgi:hypothetical protein